MVIANSLEFDATDQLLKNISVKYPLLDAKSESRLIALAQKGDDRARATIVNSNLLLVASVASRYLSTGISNHDLIVIGTIGLLRAIDKFDLSRGFRFSTYAVFWIRQTISRAIVKECRAIRVPAHAVTRITKIARTRKGLEIELNREASVEEVAEIVGLTPEQVEWYESIDEPLSLESLSKNNGGIPFEELIPEDSVDPINKIEKQEFCDRVRHYLPKLSSVERLVIERRFGFEGPEETLETIGQRLCVTRERVRQLEARALRKLRQHLSNDPMFV